LTGIRRRAEDRNDYVAGRSWLGYSGSPPALAALRATLTFSHEWTMAEASDDLITREWWLLADVLTFVMDTAGLPPPEAENLLLDFAWMGWFDDFQWHEAGARVVLDLLDSLPGSSPMRPPGAIHPRQWGRRDHRFGTENVIEWPHSRIVHRYTNPAPSVSAREIHELLVPFGALPDGHTMHLVRLRGIDVISMLRHAGLLSREEETALLRAMGFLPPEPPTPEESAEALEMTLKHEMIVAIVRRHYRKGFSAKTTLAVVTRVVGTEWGAECRRREVEISEPPHRDTVDEALKRAGIPTPWSIHTNS